MILLFRQNKGSQSKKKFHVFNPFNAGEVGVSNRLFGEEKLGKKRKVSKNVERKEN